MVRRMLTLAVILTLAVTLSACTWSQKGMAGGALIGGTIGGLAGAHGCYGLGNAGEGVLFGSALGATAGGLIGSVADYNKIKELEARIADLEAQLEAKNRELAAANAKIAELEAEIARLKARPTDGGPVMEITLGADVLFRPGSARLSDAGKSALDAAAGRIKSEFGGRFIMVEGHTDADPIKVSGWKSNWELGAARSLTVLHYLNDKGVDAAMMSAATFSKYQPVASNDTADGKAKNRRAVIVVYKNWNKAKVAK